MPISINGQDYPKFDELGDGDEVLLCEGCLYIAMPWEFRRTRRPLICPHCKKDLSTIGKGEAEEFRVNRMTGGEKIAAVRKSVGTGT